VGGAAGPGNATNYVVVLLVAVIMSKKGPDHPTRDWTRVHWGRGEATTIGTQLEL
jgi:hypothetical protein